MSYLYMNPAFEVLIFIAAFFVCFYLPGTFIISLLRYRLLFLEKIFLSSTIGILFFTFSAYVFAWSNLSQAGLFGFLVFVNMLAIRKGGYTAGAFKKKYVLPIVVVLISSVFFASPLLFRGIYFDTIHYGWGDDTWHLVLINELKAHFPPDNPGFAGVPLRGYNYFSDFVLSRFSAIFSLSSTSLYFHFFPLLLSILWGLGVYVLMALWTRRDSAGLWGIFLTMFGGGFGYIIWLSGHQDFNIDGGMGISQAATSIQNQPFSFSIVIILTILFCLHKYLTTRTRSFLVPVIFGAGLISMFKIYGGIVVFGGLLFLTIWDVWRRKFVMSAVLGMTGLLFIVTYWILRDPTSRLIFHPFWAPHNTLIDNFPWYGYTEKIYTYTQQSVIRGLVETEIYAFSVFIFGNLGTRSIGILGAGILQIRKRVFPSLFGITVFLMSLISFFVPLLFIQSGKVFETIQLAWYFLFFNALFAAIGFDFFISVIKNKLLRVFIIVLIVIATLPSAYKTLSNAFDFSRPREKLSSPFLTSMRFLAGRGSYDDTVLEIPSSLYKGSDKDLHRWYGTSRLDIVAFANKRSYLAHEYADYYNTDEKPRMEFLKHILQFIKLSSGHPDYESLRQTIEKELVESDITYIYSPQNLDSMERHKLIRNIYSADGITIYEVIR